MVINNNYKGPAVDKLYLRVFIEVKPFMGSDHGKHLSNVVRKSVNGKVT